MTLFLSFTVATSAQSGQYPSWFVTAPSGAVTAVGYAPRSYYPDNAIARAVENALHNLNLALQTDVVGQEAALIQSDQHLYAGNTFRELTDSTRLSLLTQTAIFLDTTITEQMVLVLAAAKTLTVESDSISLPDSPDWIIETPEQNGFVYAVGVSQVYFREPSGWLAAERDMRLRMAFTLEIRLTGLVKSHNQYYQEVQHSTVKQRLRNCHVIARARQGDILFVLGRMALR